MTDSYRIIKEMKNRKVKTISSQFIATKKNRQVEVFFENCFFKCFKSESNGLIKNYILDIDNYKPKNFNYIEVVDG